MVGDPPELNWNEMGDSCTDDLGESREYDAGDKLGVPTSLYLHTETIIAFIHQTGTILSIVRHCKKTIRVCSKI